MNHVDDDMAMLQGRIRILVVDYHRTQCHRTGISIERFQPTRSENVPSIPKYARDTIVILHIKLVYGIYSG